MPIGVDKVLPFLPPMDKRKLWEVIVGISAFSFWATSFVLYFVVLPTLAGVEEVNGLRHEQKEERILAAHRDFCLAMQGSEQQQYYLARRNELITEYREIDGTAFDTSAKLPPCDVLRPQEPPQP